MAAEKETTSAYMENAISVNDPSGALLIQRAPPPLVTVLGRFCLYIQAAAFEGDSAKLHLVNYFYLLSVDYFTFLAILYLAYGLRG